MACTYHFLYRNGVSSEQCKHGSRCHKLHIENPTNQYVHIFVEDNIELLGKVTSFDKWESALEVAVRAKKNSEKDDFHDLRVEHIRTIYVNEGFSFAISIRE